MNVQSGYHLASIPTVSEQDATPSVQAMFEDIKQTLQVPFVNLIWRHLATIPDGLSLTWTLAKPLYSSVTMNEAARSLRERSALKNEMTPWPHCVQESLGLSLTDRQEIISLLEDYGHANSRALLILSYLHYSISAHNHELSINIAKQEGKPKQINPLEHRTTQGEILINPARPLPASGALTSPVVELVKILNSFGSPIPSPAEPSLYRHLSYWPSFLAAFWVSVEPLERQGLLTREAIAMHEHAGLIVNQWTPASFNHQALKSDSVNAILHSIDHFTYAVIGRMIVLGDMMKKMIHF